MYKESYLNSGPHPIEVDGKSLKELEREKRMVYLRLVVNSIPQAKREVVAGSVVSFWSPPPPAVMEQMALIPVG